MREVLYNKQKQEYKQEAHISLFNYYDKKLKDVDFKNISLDVFEAFDEAFYHKKYLLSDDIELFEAWYLPFYEKFKNSARYKEIAKTYKI